MKLTLGFSPCPNDTFIFDALVNKKIDTGIYSFDYVMEDVETLNQWAFEAKLDITKLSYGSYLDLAHPYALLHSGSALGKGVGPLLVSSQPIERSELAGCRIAIPGKKTTANLLLSLAHPEAKDKTEVLFSDIEQSVLDGRFDAGLIIHESRFTYAARGLHKIMDLGDWWENEMRAAIPLGGIVIRRSLPANIAADVDRLIRESLEYSWKHYPELSPFVQENAQEMEESVMRQHINLYVNEFSTDLGPVGRHSIETLFSKAKSGGLIAGNLPENIFY
ncbi:1,4-dihydroxy-6-naphthoate synthase [Rurimicrobium arvi]|uniref:1,4-dihydroxy-6-naphtoate synthase n=1 Tax=Rurimicrobium arvi TaxID=2049916 RepID=A0ABP8MW54_9BACT